MTTKVNETTLTEPAPIQEVPKASGSPGKSSVREIAQSVRDGDLTVAEAVLKAYRDGFTEGFNTGIKHEMRGGSKPTQKSIWDF